MNNFITDIKIKKVRHLENIDIQLGNQKKHLILTGKNGCGKTSVLEELDKYLTMLIDGGATSDILWLGVEGTKKNIEKKIMLEIIFSEDELFEKLKESRINNQLYDFIYAFFSATRKNVTKKPVGINKYNIHKNKSARLNENFLQHIVNLKAERSFARDDNDTIIVNKIDLWFNKFENMLKKIFGDNSLKVIFDRKDYNFMIHRSNREPFDFNGLSAGYSAIIDIVTELILKIENTESKSFDCEGIVLIDEVENHLHVELQKNILLFLTTFFPNIQFIVTTHSPFVLQSIEQSVVYDLERKEQLSGEKLKNASYSDIIKNYFEVDSEFSNILENELNRYETLVEIFDDGNLNIDDEKELLSLDIKLDKITPMLSDTIYLRFKESQDRIKEDG